MEKKLVKKQNVNKTRKKKKRIERKKESRFLTEKKRRKSEEIYNISEQELKKQSVKDLRVLKLHSLKRTLAMRITKQKTKKH